MVMITIGALDPWQTMGSMTAYRRENETVTIKPVFLDEEDNKETEEEETSRSKIDLYSNSFDLDQKNKNKNKNKKLDSQWLNMEML